MLNIYNIFLLKEYNILKKSTINYVNLKDKLNEQLKKSLSHKSSYLKELYDINRIYKLYPNISENDIMNEIFSMYNKDFLEVNTEILRIKKRELDTLNNIITKKYSNQSETLTLSTNISLVINNLIREYIDEFNIHKFITLRADEVFPTKIYIEYYIKKFLISFLIMEFNEANMSITKERITFTGNTTKSPAQQLESKLNRLPILPFCKQYISDNYALNYDRKYIFGHLSKDILQAFFSAPTDTNPYNYTYLPLAKTSKDKRSSYTYDKYLDFLSNFKILFKDKSNQSMNFYDILQQDLLELITNSNFIIYNSTNTPMNRAITAFGENNKAEYIKLRDYCCKFYYFCSLIPMPEYRLILSDLFRQAILFEKKLNTLDYQIEMDYNNSKINYETDTTVDCFNAYIEYLVEQIIPKMLSQLYNEINNYYQITTKDMSININTLNYLNQELMLLWDSTVKEFNKAHEPYYIRKTPYGKIYDCFLFAPKKQLFCLENNQLFTNLANEHYRLYCEESLSLSDRNKDVFINLHKLIFSAVYYDSNQMKLNLDNFINNPITHASPQISINRLYNKDDTTKTFDDWCYKNDIFLKIKLYQLETNKFKEKLYSKKKK